MRVPRKNERPKLSQPFANLSISSLRGSGTPAGAQKAVGGSDQSEGLFSTLVSLATGNGEGTNTPNAGANTDSEIAGNTWLNLQVGDASLSLSSQALNEALSAQSIGQEIPEILNDLNLNAENLASMAQLGAAALNQAAKQSETATNGLPQTGIESGTDKAAANSGAQNTTPGQIQTAKLTGDQIPALLNADPSLPDTGARPRDPGALAAHNSGQEPKDVSIQAALTSARNQATGQNTPPVAELTSSLATQPSRETLIAQLQRQLAIESDSRQNTHAPATQTQNQTANNPAGTNFILAQNASAAAMAPTQLPFVQTREVLTSSDTLMVAQNGEHSTSPAAQTALFKPVQAAYQSPRINIPNVAIAITRNFNAGNNQFQIRLDPAELGRIDVRLHMDDKGAVHARLAVERPETLAMMQRDAHTLERALNQAGLESSRTNLEFSLKQNPFAGGQFASNDDKNAPDQNNSGDDQDHIQSPPEIAAATYQGSVSPGGLSIWA